MSIRKAKEKDLSRIAEIFICNNRINYFPIFKDESYSFGELQVVSFIDNYLKKDEVFKNLYIYDDGLIRGFIQMNGTEICKLYVDPWFQGRKIGHELITFAVEQFDADHLWALEKNDRALAFYRRHGFVPTGKREFEEGTDGDQPMIENCIQRLFMCRRLLISSIGLSIIRFFIQPGVTENTRIHF